MKISLSYASKLMPQVRYFFSDKKKTLLSLQQCSYPQFLSIIDNVVNSNNHHCSFNQTKKIAKFLGCELCECDPTLIFFLFFFYQNNKQWRNMYKDPLQLAQAFTPHRGSLTSGPHRYQNLEKLRILVALVWDFLLFSFFLFGSAQGRFYFSYQSKINNILAVT